VIRYLLDTNIISNVIKPNPSSRLTAWMADQEDECLFISCITLAEIWRGIMILPVGRRRGELENWFVGANGPQSLFRDRILPFDAQASLIWAELMASGQSIGRSRTSFDTIIAATAKANGCIVVTQNMRDFEGVDVFNPMD
jgi:toxin FitB